MITIDITPNPALFDRDVRIAVGGVRAGRAVTVRATARDELERTWTSWARFESDSESVDPGRQAPLEGTYTGVDPNGLFWSMRLEEGAAASPFAKTTTDPLTIHLEAEVEGEAPVRADLERLVLLPGVTRTSVREEGLRGTLFAPAGRGRRPAVIVWSGSGGGLSETKAGLLASHGYAALALAYFRFEDLPADLCEIPLEYFRTAIRRLQRQPFVDPEKIAVMGSSRGGELALLLASTYPEIHAVIGVVPSAVVWSGIGRDPEAYRHPAWTLAGKAVEFMGSREDAPVEEERPTSPEPFALTPGFLRALEDREEVERTFIPVERINGPVLLLSGSDDAMWPSSKMSDMVAARLREHGHPHPVRHLRADGTGHWIQHPHLPTTVNHSAHPLDGVDYAYGGEPAAQAHGQAAAWEGVLQFLAEVFGTQGG